MGDTALEIALKRSFDGLAMMTRENMGQDPLSGHLFVFFIPKNPTADDIVKWVRNNFELPEETDAIWDNEEDKYVYMLGGNYELRDILQDHFDDVDEEILEEAQNILMGEGWEWVRKGLY